MDSKYSIIMGLHCISITRYNSNINFKMCDYQDMIVKTDAYSLDMHAQLYST